jgi:hypothetical protein
MLDPLILIPIYEDWEALLLLLPDLAERLAEHGRQANVVVVDDGSMEHAPTAVREYHSGGIARVEVLRLRRNLGHQRALAIGLAWVNEERPDRVVVVMDGDGEDSPLDVPRLLDSLEEGGCHHVVFAARARRAEGILYWSFYQLYKLAHRLLTGVPVRVGNFSAIPPDRLSQLVVTSELWNHYAAAVFHARLPVHTVPADRARRLSGHSKMSFIALVRHGMSAMSVFGDVVGVRLLAASSGLVALVLLSLLGAIGSGDALAGWLLPLLGLALVLALQIGTICALFVFGTLQARSGVAFLPARDYRWFVEGVEPSE